MTSVQALPEGHVIGTFMREHQHILAKLDALEHAVEGGGKSELPTDQLTEIESIAQFLISMEPHHAREEQVLFPALRKRGVTGPPDVMESEHVELRTLKHSVHERALQMLESGDADWNDLAREAVRLITMLRDHIQKEDNILYPMALEVIESESTWAELRSRCDVIGYCCSTPA